MDDALPDVDDKDSLFEDVVSFVKTQKKVNSSLLHSEFNIGYSRAVRLIGQLEKEGIVAPYDGTTGTRDVIKNT